MLHHEQGYDLKMSFAADIYHEQISIIPITQMPAPTV